MNYLGIDLWDKRCWLAYTIEWIILTLPYRERVKLVWEIKKIILEKNISKIIVWIPYDLYWIQNKQLEKTKKFVLKLKNIFPNIDIVEIDERFTTIESINILSEIWEKNIKNLKDSMSAYLILETYFNKIKNS